MLGDLAPCVCGHSKVFHIAYNAKDPLCAMCLEAHEKPDLVFHTFKLDNLRYVEDLAKQRKLVL